MEERKRRKIEREFGVPIAGEILDQPLWTNTALKQIPSEGPLPLEEIFGRQAPLIVDVGCGNGRFLLGSAVWRPEMNHLGADPLPVVIRYATRRGNQRGLTNLRFMVCDGMKLVEQLLRPESVAELHCYHPQPYHDPNRYEERLITPRFLAGARRTLQPGGQLYLQTDSNAYWRYIKDIVVHFFDFQERIGKWPDAPKGRTRREILSLKRGNPIFRGVGVRKENLSERDIQELVGQLPYPTFHTEAHLKHLDFEEERAD